MFWLCLKNSVKEGIEYNMCYNFDMILLLYLLYQEINALLISGLSTLMNEATFLPLGRIYNLLATEINLLCI